MDCSICGAKNTDGAVFCNSCGARLNTDGEPVSQPADTPKPYGKYRRATLIISLIALFIAVAAVAAGLLLWLSGTTKDDAANTPSSVTASAAIPDNSGKFIGITLPTDSLERWRRDGTNLKTALEAKGYRVDLQYADNTQDVQNSQIEKQIEIGCDVLVIASIDGGALGQVLDEAKERNIPVIAYDRLLTNTDKCDYYITFSYYDESKVQGDYIVRRLGLDVGAKGPFTMECFGGDSGDNNAVIFTRGAMDVLKKYIDSGVLVVKSGQTDWPTETAISNWDAKNAEARMDKLLVTYYADENVDVVLSANDSLAQGIVASLKKAGYGTAEKPFPILTGRDCETINVGQIIRGEQSMSVFEDRRLLTSQVVTTVDAILKGQGVPYNDKYPNGVIDVKTFLCPPPYVDKNNWKTLLVDSGYYDLSDIPDAN